MTNSEEDVVIAARRVMTLTERYVDALKFIDKCPQPVPNYMDLPLALLLADSLERLEAAKEALIDARTILKAEEKLGG